VLLEARRARYTIICRIALGSKPVAAEVMIPTGSAARVESQARTGGDATRQRTGTMSQATHSV